MRCALPAFLVSSVVLVSPIRAQVRHELGVQVTGASGRPAILVAGPSWGWRPGLHDRLVLHAGLGVSQHQLAVRGEAVWQFRVEPSARRVNLYLGGGLAGQSARTTRGWIVLLAGIESGALSRRGWFAELGVGGGVRLAMGVRWRR